MKENMKKRMIIIGLAIVAVCLAGGLALFLYMKNDKSMPAVATGKTDYEAEDVVVPKITISKKEETEETETASEAAEAEEGGDIQEESTATGETKKTGSTTITQKPSAGKPKTPEEVILPEEPPELKNPDAEITPEETPEYVEPETEKAPQGGEQKDGMFYVPGFGWIEDSGKPNSSVPTDNGLHNGNMVGDM